MDQARLADQLEALLGKLRIRLRCEPFDPRVFGDLTVRGGLCTLRGELVVLVDARAPLLDRMVVLATVLSEFDLESLYVTPQVRQFIETHAVQPEQPVARARKPRLKLVR